MIDIKELRIGSVVSRYYEIGRVRSLHEDGEVQLDFTLDEVYAEDLDPVPITPDRLEKFDLKYLQNASWELGSMRIYNLSDEEKSRFRISLAGHELCILNYVHQLQNFYQSITQKEL
jgi:hypothetical protein